MNPWRRIGDQAVLYDGNWRRVLQKTFVMPMGTQCRLKYRVVIALSRLWLLP